MASTLLASFLSERTNRPPEALVGLLSETLNVVDCGVVLADATHEDFPIIYANQAFETLTGYEAHEILGKNPRFLQHDDRSQPVLHEVRMALKRHEAWNGIIRNYHKNGESFLNELSLTPVFNASGTVEFYIGTCKPVSDKQKLELALKESQTRQLLIQKATNDIIWDWMPRTGIIHWNESLQTLLNYPLDTNADYNYEWWREQLHPDDREETVSSLEQALHSGSNWKHEYRFRRANGSYANIIDRGYIVRNEQGEVIRMIGSMMDITQQKQTEEALRQSELKLNRLVESNLIGIVIGDFQGRIFEANEAYLSMLGYRREEFVPGLLSWKELTPSEWWERDQAGILELEKTGVTRPYEKQYWRKDGQRVDCLIGITMLNPQEQTGLCFVLDITDEKRAEANLKQSLARESLIRKITEITSESFDLQSTLTLVSREIGLFYNSDRCIVLRYDTQPDKIYLQLAGQYCKSPDIVPLTQEELPLQSFQIDHVNPSNLDYIRASSSSEYLELICKTLENHHVTSQYFTQEHLEQYLQKYNIHAVLGIGVNYKGTPYGAILLHQCHTEREWSNEELALLKSIATHLGVAFYQTHLYQQEQHAKTEAEIANRRKDRVLANMSHEFRTPLNAVIGFSQMMEQGLAGPVTDKQRQYLQNICLSGNHLLEIVNDLLDISKIEAGQTDMNIEWIALKPVVNEVSSVLQHMATQKQVQLVFEISESIDSIKADPARFRQILYNLMSNAIKYNRHQGKVTVRMFQSLDNQWFVCEVSDTGIGIPKELQPHIFQEYYQVDLPQEKRQEGTGLGLSLTKKLVESHQGCIEFESWEGIGSTFRFKLPLDFHHPPLPEK